METLLTEAEAAKLLGISQRTLEKWRSRGQGPPFARIGKAVRYPSQALENWVQGQLQFPAPAPRITMEAQGAAKGARHFPVRSLNPRLGRHRRKSDIPRTMTTSAAPPGGLVPPSTDAG